MEEQPKTGVFASLNRYFSDYHTPQVVTIKNRWLKIPYLLCSWMVFAYILVYKLGYQKAFMLFENTQGHVYGFLSFPMALQEYFTCNDGDFDCDRAPPKHHDYCTEKHLQHEHPGKITMHGKEYRRNVSGCYTNDIHMDAGPVVFIPTMLTWINQSWNEEAQEWYNDAIKEVYMRDIESFLLRLQSSYRAEHLGLTAESVNLLGVVNMPNGTQCTIPCHSRKGHPEDCTSQTVQHGYRKSCIELLADAREEDIFASKWGDSMSVATMLELASIDLDKERPLMDGLTYRQSGGVIDINVRFQNMDYFRWNPLSPHFLDTTVTYAYQTGLSQDFSGSAVYTTKVLTNNDPNSYKRTLERTTGLRIQLSLSGQVAGFRLGQCMTTLAVTTSLFAVAILAVEWVMVWFYQKCGNKQAMTAAYMLDVYKKDESIHPADFMGIVETHAEGAFVSYRKLDQEENLYHEVDRKKKAENARKSGKKPTHESDLIAKPDEAME